MTEVDNNHRYIDPLYVDNYLFLYNKESQNAKKIKRKFQKKKEGGILYPNVYNDYHQDAHKLLYEYIINLKKNKTLDSYSTIGILSDKCVIDNNITLIPPPPLEWDVLCLQSDITHYNFKETNNNIYWCNTKINGSYNFVINRKNIEVVLDILKVSKDWSSFITLLNDNCKVFSITQYNLSHNIDTYIKFQHDTYNAKGVDIDTKNKLMNEYKKSVIQFINKNKKLTSTKHFIRTFDQQYDGWDTVKQWHIYPNVSLICILTNEKTFFNTLYTFLSMDYPRDKLELIVVDDNDYEKSLKRILPEDKRIKIINLTPKNKQDDKQVVPLGYKLNCAVKYASNELVYHFFDTDVHFPDKLKELVKVQVVSDINCIMTYDHAIESNEYKEHDSNFDTVNNVPYLGNMLYTKNWWKVNCFRDKESDNILLLYNFIKNRMDCIYFIPFLHFGFSVIENPYKNLIENSNKNFPFKFIKLIKHTGIQEAYNVSFVEQ